MSVELLAALVGAALLLALWMIWWPSAQRNTRRPLHLEYDVGERPAGLSGAFRAFGDATARATWGSPSVETWRRACAASLEASRRRRGLEEVE